jgi:hypothetical protein
MLSQVHSTFSKNWCSLTHHEDRLGTAGIGEIKEHQFFENVEWTWDNIRQRELELLFFVV